MSKLLLLGAVFLVMVGCGCGKPGEATGHAKCTDASGATIFDQDFKDISVSETRTRIIKTNGQRLWISGGTCVITEKR